MGSVLLTMTKKLIDDCTSYDVSDDAQHIHRCGLLSGADDHIMQRQRIYSLSTGEAIIPFGAQGPAEHQSHISPPTWTSDALS